MANRFEYLSLDVSKENEVTELIVVQQGEHISLTLDVDVTSYYEPFQLTENTTASFMCVRPDAEPVIAAARITDYENGHIQFDVPHSVCDVEGKIALAYFYLVDEETGWAATTDKFTIVVNKGITVNEEDLLAYIEPLNSMLKEYEDKLKELQEKYNNGEFKGEPGEKGEVGAGLNVIDVLESIDNLPSDAEAGDAYMIDNNLWVMGKAGEWVNTGSVRGASVTGARINENGELIMTIE